MDDAESLIFFYLFFVNLKTTKNIKLRVNFEQISENLCPVTVILHLSGYLQFTPPGHTGSSNSDNTLCCPDNL